MRILGIDPGLQKTGWGIIEQNGHALSFVACGLIRTDAKAPLFERLAKIDFDLAQVVQEYYPDTAAIEETFVNKNAASALRLGFARGVAIVAPARLGLYVGEYPATIVKKSVTGTGGAKKEQVGMMIRTLLPHCGQPSEDEADALAVAICHAHHMDTKNRVGGVMAGGKR